MRECVTVPESGCVRARELGVQQRRDELVCAAMAEPRRTPTGFRKWPVGAAKGKGGFRRELGEEVTVGLSGKSFELGEVHSDGKSKKKPAAVGEDEGLTASLLLPVLVHAVEEEEGRLAVLLVA